MKQFTILYICLLCSFLSYSQTAGFEIRNTDKNTLVSNGSTFYRSTDVHSNEVYIFTIKNLSSASQTFNFFKTDVLMNHIGPADSAYAYFCTGVFCYGSTTYSAAVTLTANEVMTLRFDLDEASAIGLSTVKYDIQNASNTQSFTVTFKFNNPAGINETSNPLNQIGSVFPNPGNSLQTVNFTANHDSKLTYSVSTISGEIVFANSMDVVNGNNQLNIPSATLPSGLYFLTLQNGHELISKMFVVNH